MEYDPRWKMTSDGRRPSMDDDAHWKLTFNMMKDNFQWKMPFNGRQPSAEDDNNLWRTTLIGKRHFDKRQPLIEDDRLIEKD